jgi:sugar phosphate isomerase/epimerase
LAHLMGFKWLRTKMTVKDGELAPIDNWTEVIDSVLPLAERLDIKLLPEIHSPSKLSSGFITHYLDYIKRTGTKHFGLNIDFGVFDTNVREGSAVIQPEEIIPLLPYVYCCHAKFVSMDDNFHETRIPYEKILKILVDNGYDGYLLSEYEGRDKYDDGYEVGQTLRKQHIMMKNILGY